MLTLKEYTSLARIILKSKYPELLHDDELIGQIISMLAQCDIDYNPNIGSLIGYRAAKISWLIKTYLLKRTKELRPLYIETARFNQEYYDRYHLDNRDYVEFLLEDLAPQERRAIEAYYLHSKSQVEIAKIEQTSKSYINIILRQAKQKMSRKAHRELHKR